MRAMVVKRYGPPDVFEVREIPDPQPKPGEVVIRVKAVGVNFADLLQRMGIYPGTPKPPFVPGFEVSGVVEKIAEGGKAGDGEPLHIGGAGGARVSVAAGYALRRRGGNSRELPHCVSFDVCDGQSAVRRPHSDSRGGGRRGNRRGAAGEGARPGNLRDGGPCETGILAQDRRGPRD